MGRAMVPALMYTLHHTTKGNTIMTTNAKKAAKAAIKSATLSVVAKPTVLPTILKTLVRREYTAFMGIQKGEMTDFNCLKDLILSTPLNDALVINLLVADIQNIYGEEQKAAAQIRITIIRNARKVAYGGVKDKHVVQGRGMSAVRTALDSVQSIRELRKAMSDAKPETLKEVQATPDAKKKASTKKVEPAAPVEITKAPDAFAAAIRTLELCEKFLSAGTDANLIGVLDQAISALKTAEIAALIPRDTQGKVKQSKAA